MRCLAGGKQNDLVELTLRGDLVAAYQMDAGAPGAAFGIVITGSPGSVRFGAVDDDLNTVTVWTVHRDHRKSTAGWRRSNFGDPPIRNSRWRARCAGSPRHALNIFDSETGRVHRSINKSGASAPGQVIIGRHLLRTPSWRSASSPPRPPGASFCRT